MARRCYGRTTASRGRVALRSRRSSGLITPSLSSARAPIRRSTATPVFWRPTGARQRGSPAILKSGATRACSALASRRLLRWPRDDFCVAWTALDAVRAGFETFVVEDASRGIDTNGSLARALADLDAAGVSRLKAAALA